jgi:ribonuclease HI
MISVYIATSYNAVDRIGGAAAVLEYKGKTKDILYKSTNETNMQLFGIMKEKALESIKNKENYNIVFYGTDPVICAKHKASVKIDGLMKYAKNKSKIALHTQPMQDFINFFEGEII